MAEKTISLTVDINDGERFHTDVTAVDLAAIHLADEISVKGVRAKPLSTLVYMDDDNAVTHINIIAERVR